MLAPPPAAFSTLRRRDHRAARRPPPPEHRSRRPSRRLEDPPLFADVRAAASRDVALPPPRARRGGAARACRHLGRSEESPAIRIWTASSARRPTPSVDARAARRRAPRLFPPCFRRARARALGLRAPRRARGARRASRSARRLLREARLAVATLASGGAGRADDWRAAVCSSVAEDARRGRRARPRSRVSRWRRAARALLHVRAAARVAEALNTSAPTARRSICGSRARRRDAAASRPKRARGRRASSLGGTTLVLTATPRAYAKRQARARDDDDVAPLSASMDDGARCTVGARERLRAARPNRARRVGLASRARAQNQLARLRHRGLLSWRERERDAARARSPRASPCLRTQARARDIRSQQPPARRAAAARPTR